MTKHAFDTFKGSPVIRIDEVNPKTNKDQYVISFGVRKAQAILEQLESIKKFVQDNTEKKGA